MLKILVISTIVATIAGTPFKNEIVSVTNEDLSSQYRLTNEVIPTFYDVRLFIDPNNAESFTGIVSIRVIPNVAVDEIVLHAMEMAVSNIRIHTDLDETNLYNDHTLATDDTHFLRIRLTRTITALQPHTIHINYVGQYAENMFGVYVSTYETATGVRRLVTSQLQPTFARRAFPCFDEPSMKAVFRTTIYAPAEFTTVRSNMPERTEGAPNWPNVDGYVRHEFQDTLVMSSYLIAYLVSDFPYIDNSVNPIYDRPFRVYSRPGTQETAEFALDFGQRNLVSLEEYIDLPYHFPKMDKVAVPDFAAGAMENWGLVIYREVALLVQEGVTTTAVRQNIGRIITHENMHQWFGNEVTPQSWTYTWLNEGFANFFENFATDFVLSEWRMMDQFVFNMQNVFQSDAVLSVNPMTHPVYTPSQVLGTFNAVAYQKSGSVIRMLQHFLTPEVFRRGLIIYIRDNSRGVVTPQNLYAALQQALDESETSLPAGYTVANILTAWTTQGGFPVITVRRSAPSANSVFISQERYLTDPSLSSTDRWRIPVNWVLSTDVNFTDTSPQAWVPHTFPAVAIDIPDLSEAEWFIFNKQQTGYYRVNYDVNNWQALVRVLNSSHDSIHVLNRAQLIDDAFNLARNGRLDYTVPLELALYLVRESDYIPWAAANAAFSYLDTVLSGSPGYEWFQEYLRELSLPLFTDLGFHVTDEDEHVTAFHRNIILNLNCRHGNENCTDYAQSLLENTQTVLHPDIQTTVYCSGLRGGSAETFNRLWDMFLQTTDSSQESILLNALGCTSNSDRLEFYLNQMISDDSEVREQDRHTILVSVINSGPDNLDAALEFILENFLEIQQRVQGLTGTTNILNALSRTLSTREHEEKIDEILTRYEGDFTAGEQASIAAIKENIAASVIWADQNFNVVNSWLDERYNDATRLTLTTLLALPFILLAYNIS